MVRRCTGWRSSLADRGSDRRRAAHATRCRRRGRSLGRRTARRRFRRPDDSTNPSNLDRPIPSRLCLPNQSWTRVTLSSSNQTQAYKPNPSHRIDARGLTQPTHSQLSKLKHRYFNFYQFHVRGVTMHSPARSPHFTVNSTNNRIVLTTTVLSCPLRSQK